MLSTIPLLVPPVLFRHPGLESATHNLMSGNLIAAHNEIGTILDREPNNLAAIHVRALAILLQGRIGEAADLLAFIVRRNPWLSDVQFNLGLVLVALGRYEQGLMHIRRGFTQMPGLPHAEKAIAAVKSLVGASPPLQRKLRRGCIISEPAFYGNRLFDHQTSRDSVLLPYRRLRDAFLMCGVDLSTRDINPPEHSDFVVYISDYGNGPAPDQKHKSFLITNEPPSILPHNWTAEFFEKFNKVFTFDDSLVDGKKFIKWNVPNHFSPPRPMEQDVDRSKFCVMINGAKIINFPCELYSERIRVIRWFERNHPEDFDLYGAGWNSADFPSYRGSPKNKAEVLPRYRFSICYENMAGIPGMFDTKIFDCLQNGVIPVYWGASNVEDYIPEECFIDRRNFQNMEGLYQYMKSIPDTKYVAMRRAIFEFLSGAECTEFGVDYFVQTILRHTLPLVGHSDPA